MPVHPRWTDNPFRDPNLTPEQVEAIEKRNEALRIYRETGDEGPAIELGLFPAKDEKSTKTVRPIIPGLPGRAGDRTQRGQPKEDTPKPRKEDETGNPTA